MRTVIMVALCGSLGATCRWAIGIWLNKEDGFPWGTLTVNAFGSLLLGLLMGMTLVTPRLSEEWRGPIFTGLGAGFLGSFTTFSSFAVESIKMIEGQQWRNTILYLSAQLLSGLILAFIGLQLGRLFFPSSP